jgi:anti-anti-sigma factor
MKIKTQDYNDLTVVELQGELTSDFTEQLAGTVENVVSRKKAGIVYDMSQVSFVDSKGLEHLLWCRDHCHDGMCGFKMAGLNENCSTILEITRMQKEFDSYGELADAVKSFG